MARGIFRFKQFSVDQTGCAMKINTDGVLLGAFVETDNTAVRILDIGAGTGVIALMLAQRFPQAQIDAVEVDQLAAETAAKNFENSPFADRLKLHAQGFEDYFQQNPSTKYDLIVSNPPFHIYSLQSKETSKALARHADEAFFERLIKAVAHRLSENGSCWLVLPLQTAELVEKLSATYGLFTNQVIEISSYPDSPAHRQILVLSRQEKTKLYSPFIIYSSPKEYTPEYREKLKDFLLIFN